MLAVRIIRGIKEDCLYLIWHDPYSQSMRSDLGKGFMFSNRNEISTKSPLVQSVSFLTFGTRNRTSANRIPPSRKMVGAKAKGPALPPNLSYLLCSERLDLEVHTTHAAHPPARRHAASTCVPLRNFGHHGFGGDQESCDRGRVLDRHTNNLGRVDDALGDQVPVFAGLGVEAVGILILLEDLADDHRAVLTRVDRDLAGWIGQRLAHDIDAGLLVVVLGAKPLEVLGGAQQRDAAARHNAFLNRRTGRMHRIINAILALPDLDLGRATDADHRDAARELGQTLLQLLTVVVRGGFLDLRLDLRNAGFDVGLLAGAVDDGGVLLVDHHLLGAAEHLQRDVLELDAEIFRDRGAAGQNRDVLQHRLAAIAEAGSLDGCDLQTAAQTVDDQCRQRLAFDVFR